MFAGASPSLNFKQTGSSSLFSLASSLFNTGGRAPIVHRDEPFTALQTGGLLPTIHIDELSLQHRRTSDEPSTALQTGGLLPTIHIDELFLQHRRTSSYMFAGASPSLNFKQTGPSPPFTLSSSPLNVDGRAPIVHNDEPFIGAQANRILPAIQIYEAHPSTQRNEPLPLTIICLTSFYKSTLQAPLWFTRKNSYRSLPKDLL